MKYFLYARKSTDEDDKQLLSIEAQLEELREYAARERLEVVREFVEKRTAKEPGRPFFNDLLRRIEKGEADALLAWHPDRLARNSVDGGRIIYLVDTGKLAALKVLCGQPQRECAARTAAEAAHWRLPGPRAHRLRERAAPAHHRDRREDGPAGQEAVRDLCERRNELSGHLGHGEPDGLADLPGPFFPQVLDAVPAVESVLYRHDAVQGRIVRREARAAGFPRIV